MFDSWIWIDILDEVSLRQSLDGGALSDTALG
jgi:hypothetical protein